MLKKSLNHPDELRIFTKGELSLVSFGAMTLGRGTFQPGWKWSECVQPIAKTKSCESPHFGYVVKGRMHIAMDDGTHLEFGPGDAMFVPSGHDAWVVGDEVCEIIDFTGYGEYAK